MQRFPLLLLFTAVLASTAFSQPPATVSTKEDAIKVAKAYVQKTSPELDISQKDPTAEFFPNAPAHGGAIWAVGFAYPAPKDPATGKIVGVRPFIGLGVWVHVDGTVEGAFSHTP